MNYIDKISKLNVGKVGDHRRPRKPVMLLAILDYIEDEVREVIINTHFSNHRNNLRTLIRNEKEYLLNLLFYRSPRQCRYKMFLQETKSNQWNDIRNN